MKKVLVIGTGNLGKRYLQAILSNNGDFRCFCYDQNPEALNSVDIFLKNSNVSASRLTKRFSLDEILNDIDRQSLVIVSTTAQDRLGLVSLITLKKPETMIIEKPVTQNKEDYETVARLCKEAEVPAFTHYTLRFQPFCKVLKEMVISDQPFEMTSILPAMGIACVSIHYIDLFLWMFNISAPLLKVFSYLGTYEQKRKGFYDMYGELIIRSEKNGTGRFINAESNGIRTLEVMLADKVISVYEDQRVMTIIRKTDNKTIEVREVEYLFASQYLPHVINNYLNGNINLSGELVDLETAYISHRIIFDFMERTGNRNLNIT
jgi:predicted dehydrogenase